MWSSYFKDKMYFSHLQHCFPSRNLPKKKEKGPFWQIMKNDELGRQNRISFSPQSSGVLVSAQKPTQSWGKGLFVAFADVSGINTTAEFKLPMWSQPADKIPES